RRRPGSERRRWRPDGDPQEHRGRGRLEGRSRSEVRDLARDREGRDLGRIEYPVGEAEPVPLVTEVGFRMEVGEDDPAWTDGRMEGRLLRLLRDGKERPLIDLAGTVDQQAARPRHLERDLERPVARQVTGLEALARRVAADRVGRVARFAARRIG